jgi:hypothetical protein
MAREASAVAGDQQTRSTNLDPAPQFTVHEVEPIGASGVTLTGRCWFEPVNVGSAFRRVVALPCTELDEGWLCDLTVESIGVFDQFVDSLSQMMSARLWLRGEQPEVLQPGEHGERLLLVGADPSEGQWSWDGRLWQRQH